MAAKAARSAKPAPKRGPGRPPKPKPEPPKRPAHRPSQYKQEYAEQAKLLCEKGLTDIEIAEVFGVHVVTMYRWQAKYPELRNALKVGKAECDDRVERSLYHRAIGYTFKSEKVFQHQGKIVRTATVEHVPPDSTAMIFWLKNRRKEEWRDRHEHTGDSGGPLQIQLVKGDEAL